MTDDLTPEEREQFNQLPRERMPAGLEGRVVAALREEGVLAKPGRLVVLTRSRVAGLLAACFALVIGAYSAGLHRGNDIRPLPATLAPALEESQQLEQPRTHPEPLRETPAPGSRSQASPPVVADSRDDVGSLSKPEERKDAGAASPKKEDERQASGVMKKSLERAEAPASPSAAFAPSPEAQALNAAPAPKQTVSFWLDGTRFTVEADSARIVRDERGRLLLIYTPDGITRIRLSDVP